MNIFKVRQCLNEIERLRSITTVRHGITEQDIQDDIQYQKNLIAAELSQPVKLNLQEAPPAIFSPDDFEELRA